jgi:hypothetical protein
MNHRSRALACLASIVLAIGCASPKTAGTPQPTTINVAPQTRVAPPPTPEDTSPQGTIAVGETTPALGSLIGAETVLRMAVNYSVHKFIAGQDSIVVIFKKQGGGTWEPAQQLLTSAQGKVVFELLGKDLLVQPDLVHPFQIRFVLVSRRTRPEPMRHLQATSVVSFQAPLTAEEKKEGTKFIPPGIGKGLLVSDMLHDPRYKPRLPPELNFSGSVVWGLFKLCVDTEGKVTAVQMLKSAHRLVDEPWVAILRTLQHKPYSIGNRPVPYCYPLRLEVRSQD